MRLTLFTLVSSALLVACGAPSHQPETAASPQAAPAAAPTLEQIGSATFSGIYEEPVTLADGKWEGEPFSPEGASRPQVLLVASVMPTGDLDGDGAAEAVAVLAESSGGSGSNGYLAVMKSTAAGVENTTTALIGDRVQIVSLGIEAGAISGVFVQTGDGDAMCCPTAKVRRSWKMEGAQLVELPAEDLGKVSIADLAGAWQLVEMPYGTPLPDGVEVTLNFDGTTASGKSGCNNYSGTIAETSPGELEPGLFMGTQMFCEGPSMEVEGAYMKALGKASQYSFLGTRLGISHATDEGGTETMVFQRAE